METAEQLKIRQLEQKILTKDRINKEWEQRFARESADRFAALPANITGGMDSDLTAIALFHEKQDVNERTIAKLEANAVRAKTKIDLLGQKGMEYLRKFEAMSRENQRLKAALARKTSEMRDSARETVNLENRISDLQHQLYSRINSETPTDFRREIQKLHEEKSSLIEAKDDACMEGVRLVHQLRDYSSALKRKEGVIEDLKAKLAREENETENFVEIRKKLEETISQHETTIANQLKEIGKNCADIEDLKRKLKTACSDAQSFIDRKELYKRELNQLKATLPKLEIGGKPNAQCTNCDQYRRKVLELEASSDALRREVKMLEDMDKRLRTDNEEIRKDDADLRARCRNLEQEKDKITESNKSLHGTISKQGITIRDQRNSLKALAVEKEKLERGKLAIKTRLKIAFVKLRAELKAVAAEKSRLATEAAKLIGAQKDELSEMREKIASHSNASFLAHLQERGRLAETIEVLRLDLEATRNSLNNTNDRLNYTNSARQAQDQRVSILETNLRKSKEEFESASNKARKSKEDFEAASNRVRVLEAKVQESVPKPDFEAASNRVRVLEAKVQESVPKPDFEAASNRVRVLEAKVQESVPKPEFVRLTAEVTSKQEESRQLKAKIVTLETDIWNLEKMALHVDHLEQRIAVLQERLISSQLSVPPMP